MVSLVLLAAAVLWLNRAHTPRGAAATAPSRLHACVSSALRPLSSVVRPLFSALRAPSLSLPSPPATHRPPPATFPPLPSDPFAAAEPLRRSETPATGAAADECVRVRLVRAAFKYPLVRIEERVRRAAGGAPEAVLERTAMVGDHILLQLRPGATPADLAALNGRLGGTVRRTLHRPGLYLVAFDPADLDTVPRMAAAYARSGAAAAAEPDYLVRTTDRTPNDPRLPELWGMAQIHAPAAWDIAIGSGNAVVGVIDTGVNYPHVDLAANAWVNPLENSTNGVDDDANGYVDDWRGWDFAYDDNAPFDDGGHGTHVAGTIAAVGDNGLGVVGVLWSAKIMPLKFIDQYGNGATSDAIEALHYATMMRTNGVNIRVTNNSWGGGGYSDTLRQAIADAGRAGILFIAAAGNYAQDNDLVAFYPASYPLDNIVAVAASTPTDALASFSHYGVQSVDLAAPGVSVLSLSGYSNYATLSGTSMATPHVSGVAALVADVFPEADYRTIRQSVLGGVDPVPALAGKVATGGRLSAIGALRQVVPSIAHTPLVNTVNDVDAYPIVATILPRAMLDPAGLTVLWNTDGSTNSFVTNTLVWTDANRYLGWLPAQPHGTTMHYFIRVRTTAGTVATDPPGAPAALHTFASVGPTTLWVAGTPEEHGAATPAYGIHELPSGIVVNASAPLYADVTVTQRYACVGWVGIGAVPPTGTSTAVTFALERMSAIAWQWERQLPLAQTSAPAGAVATGTWWRAGAPGQTVAAPMTFAAGGTNWHFVEWRVDGARQPDASAPAANPAAGFVMAGPRSAAAVYLPEDADGDGDGLPDWWERTWFGSLAPGPNDDPDGDGYRNAEEFADRTDPRDPASVPSAPAIVHVPLADPQTAPAPWRIAAAVTDNFQVADVWLRWRRVPLGWQRTRMFANGAAGGYEAAIPAPGAMGDTYEYRIEATDAAGYAAENGPYRFFVAYPVASVAATNLAQVLPPGGVTNVSLSIANGGNTSLVWQLRAGWPDSVARGTNGWTHGGRNDLWHVATNRGVSAPAAWYGGRDSTRQYVDSMNAWLALPPLRLGTNAVFSFRHWAKMEYDAEQNDDHYWDGGIVEISTNDGASFAPIAPVGGYPNRITDNPASPFAPDTPCYGGTGGWQQAAFDLGAFAGQTVRLRFRFGSDGYVTEEGWYIDDVLVMPGALTNDWLSLTPAAGVLAAPGVASVTLGYSAADIPTGDFDALLQLVSDDPLAPTQALAAALSVRSPPRMTAVAAAQTSTNGEGWVTVTGTVYDVDGEWCRVEARRSIDGGATWSAAALIAASSAFGVPVLTNGAAGEADGVPAAASNRLTLTWATTNAPAPVMLSTNALVALRAWDGRYWSPSVTSQPFLVDNEAPAMPTALVVTSHSPVTWSTNRLVRAACAPVGDGAGVGVAGYLFVGYNGTPASLAARAFSNAPAAVVPLPVDDNDWQITVRAVDGYGNASPTNGVGPFWVDATPPDPSGASIYYLRSPVGNYVVGPVITCMWVNVSDNLSGIAAYYYGLANGEGTTNGLAATTNAGVLAGAALDATNTVYVWARDVAGNIGAAARQAVLVLDPGTDFDHDGQLTLEEEIAGTDAARGNSVFRISGLTATGTPAGVVVQWPSLLGRTYSLCWRGDMTNGAPAWQVQSGCVDVPGTGGAMSYTDTVSTATQRYYRVTVTRP